MRFIASLGVSVLALTVSSTTLAADLLGVTISLNNVKARTINLASGESRPLIDTSRPLTPAEIADSDLYWHAVQSYQSGGGLFGDWGEWFYVHANPLLGTQGNIFDAGNSRAQIHVEPGAVTLHESIQDSDELKHRLANPLPVGLPYDMHFEFHDTHLGYSDQSIFLGTNSAVEVTAVVTLSQQNDPSIFVTDSILSEALGKTMTTAYAKTRGVFNLYLSAAGGTSPLISSTGATLFFVDSYSVDHEGHVTTSHEGNIPLNDDEPSSYVVVARLENRSAQPIVVGVSASMVTDTYMTTSFDPTLVSSVPEPGSFALAAVGLGLMGWQRARRQGAQKAQKDPKSQEAAHLV